MYLHSIPVGRRLAIRVRTLDDRWGDASEHSGGTLLDHRLRWTSLFSRVCWIDQRSSWGEQSPFRGIFRRIHRFERPWFGRRHSGYDTQKCPSYLLDDEWSTHIYRILCKNYCWCRFCCCRVSNLSGFCHARIPQMQIYGLRIELSSFHVSFRCDGRLIYLIFSTDDRKLEPLLRCKPWWLRPPDFGFRRPEFQRSRRIPVDHIVRGDIAFFPAR